MIALTWFKSDGTRIADSASLPAGTYYAEVPRFECARLASMFFRWDATAAAPLTFEVTDDPSLTPYAAAAAGWVTAPAPSPSALTTLTIAGGSAGVDTRYAIDVPHGRLRVKAVVGTAGVIEAFANTKDD